MRGDRYELQPSCGPVHDAGRSIAVLRRNCFRGGRAVGSVLAAVSHGGVSLTQPPGDEAG